MDKKKALILGSVGVASALGLGWILSKVIKGNGGNGGDTCGSGYHYDEELGGCVPDSSDPPPDTEMTPSAIWERAHLLYSNDAVDSAGFPIEAPPPPLEIIGFEITHIYPTAEVRRHPAEDWLDRLNSEDDAVIVEIAGDPCHMEAGDGTILPCAGATRFGQLRGHTWGNSLRVYEWQGEWVEIWGGVLSYGTPTQYKLAEAIVTIKSGSSFRVPPNIFNLRYTLMPVGNWKYYCFSQGGMLSGENMSVARSEWLYLPEGVPVSLPVTLYAYGGNFSSYNPGSPMALGNYNAQVGISWGGCLISYNESWYNPPSTKEDYLSDEEMGMTCDDSGAVVALDQSVRNTIFSYSICQSEVLADVLKCWYIPPGCRCMGPSFGVPYGNGVFTNTGTISNTFLVNVSAYGDQ